MIRRFGAGAKVVYGLMVILALALLGGAPGFAPISALAEQGRPLLSVQMTASPEEMVEPGDILLSFSIENNSTADAMGVYLSSADGLLSEPLGQIAAGEKQTFTRQHSVTENELDAGEITFIVSHDDPEDSSQKVNYAVHAAIRRSDVQPRAEFTRQFSSRSAPAGSALTITYRIRNSGNVALTNLRVQDSLGDFTGRIERLEAGEARTLISRVTITEAAVSTAALSYGAEGAGDEIYLNTLEDVSIGLAQSGISHQFSVNPALLNGDKAEVWLRLENSGNVDILDVSVTDALYGGIIADGLRLNAGSEALELHRSYALRGEDGFCWRVQGVSESGERIDFTTETIGATPLAEGEFSPLSLSVEALTPRIRRAGDVTLKVRVVNPGGVSVREVALTEETLGLVRSFSILPAGATIERDVILHVREDSQYLFTIRYMTPEGAVEAISATADVAIASDGVVPEGAERGFFEFSGNSIKIGGSSTFAVLLILGCAVLLVLIVMLVIATRRARMEKRLRIAAEKQRRKEEMGKTTRFTPVRAPAKKRKGRTG